MHVGRIWAHGLNLPSVREQLFISLACCRHTNSANASSSSLGLLYEANLANARDESRDFLELHFAAILPIIEELALRGRLREASHFDLSWQGTNVSVSDVMFFSSTFVVHFVDHLDMC